MADYYPLLARALDALPDRTPALRKAVYDRARSALIGQLRTLEPPLPDEAIETERKALDAAIERLEAAYGTPVAPLPPPPPQA
ncbi:histidine kinase, partial [Methylobacterium sp. WL9]